MAIALAIDAITLAMRVLIELACDIELKLLQRLFLARVNAALRADTRRLRVAPPRGLPHAALDGQTAVSPCPLSRGQMSAAESGTMPNELDKARSTQLHGEGRARRARLTNAASSNCRAVGKTALSTRNAASAAHLPLMFKPKGLSASGQKRPRMGPRWRTSARDPVSPNPFLKRLRIKGAILPST